MKQFHIYFNMFNINKIIKDFKFIFLKFDNFSENYSFAPTETALKNFICIIWINEMNVIENN